MVLSYMKPVHTVRGGGSEFSDCREVNSHLRDF